MKYGKCDKCKKPATNETVCKVRLAPLVTCDARFGRCDGCGGETNVTRAVRVHQARRHPLPTD